MKPTELLSLKSIGGLLPKIPIAGKRAMVKNKKSDLIQSENQGAHISQVIINCPSKLPLWTTVTHLLGDLNNLNHFL